MVRKHHEGARNQETDHIVRRVGCQKYRYPSGTSKRADGDAILRSPRDEVSFVVGRGRKEGGEQPRSSNRLRYCIPFSQYSSIPATTRTDLYRHLLSKHVARQRGHRALVIVPKPKRDTWNRHNRHHPSQECSTPPTDHLIPNS